MSNKRSLQADVCCESAPSGDTKRQCQADAADPDLALAASLLDGVGAAASSSPVYDSDDGDVSGDEQCCSDKNGTKCFCILAGDWQHESWERELPAYLYAAALDRLEIAWQNGAISDSTALDILSDVCHGEILGYMACEDALQVLIFRALQLESAVKDKIIEKLRAQLQAAKPNGQTETVKH